MKRHSLALAILVIGLMQQQGILNLEVDVNLEELQMTLEQFILSNQDLALKVEFLVLIENFLTKFCAEVCEDLNISSLPFNRKVLNALRQGGSNMPSLYLTSPLDQLWIRRIAKEIVFAVRFFTVETQYSKPQFRQGQKTVFV